MSAQTDAHPYVLGDPITAAGLPPWDGTGIPLPVDDAGWPVVPDEERVLKITSPHDGDLVDPLTPIKGRGAEDGDTVDLYMDSSDDGKVAVASTTADDRGVFEFAGDIPLEVSPEGIVVGVGAKRSAKVHVTVDLPDPDEEDDDENVERGLDTSDVDGQDFSDEGYDPSDHTVTEVKAYLDENPDQTDYVLDRERAGKARTTLIGD